MSDPKQGDPQHALKRAAARRAEDTTQLPPIGRATTFDDIVQGRKPVDELSTVDDSLPFFQDVSSTLDSQEDFIKDPTDFTDRATEIRQTKRRRTILLALAGFLLLIVAGFFFTQLLLSSANGRDTAPVPGASSAPPVTPNTEAPTASVFAGDFPEGVTIPTGEVLVKQNPDAATAFLASAEALNTVHTLDILNSTLTPVTRGCSVVIATDFCFAGTGTAEGVEFSTYFFKDIVQSKIFAPVNDSAPVAVAGAVAAHKVFVNFTGGAETAGIVIAFADGSGYFLTTTDAAAVETLAPLLAAL